MYRLEDLVDDELKSLLFAVKFLGKQLSDKFWPKNSIFSNFQGDILLTEEQLDYLISLEDDSSNIEEENSSRRKRQASTVMAKWTGPVNYYFDPVANYSK